MSGAVLPEAIEAQDLFDSIPVDNLRQKTVRGGAITACTQAATFLLQIGSTMILARLLSPADYGLVAMVTVLTGILNVFRDGGLSTATVQKASVTRAQVSTLFWVNCGLGCLFAIAAFASAPVLARVFHEPKLFGITLALAIPFPLNALAVQHQALLSRRMRYTTLAIIEIVSFAVGIGVAIGMAIRGFGYWALVGMPIAGSLARVIALAVAVPWLPGLPSRRSGIRSMLRFGGYVTVSNAMNYLFRNADNALIGWYWGAGPLGLYSKAYGLLMLPISQVNSPLSGVAVPALSRLQNDPERFRRTFLGGYSIAACVIMPVVAFLAIFADEAILLLLGPKWGSAVGLFRLLAPAALVGALLNPFGWIFIATGRPDRQFRLGIVWSGLLICAFAVGLRFGPAGVAAGYSIMSCCLALPLCLYALGGSSIRLRDLMDALKAPAWSTFLAGLFGLAISLTLPRTVPATVRALVGGTVMSAIYLFLLLVVMKRWHFYRELFGQLFTKKVS